MSYELNHSSEESEIGFVCGSVFTRFYGETNWQIECSQAESVPTPERRVVGLREPYRGPSRLPYRDDD